jgi:hypothetical protein
MPTSRNPYTPMLLTFNPRRVYGWENEITSILQVITAPEPNSHAIYGLRAVGKTTLLKFLKDREGASRRYADFVNADYRPGGRRRLLFVYINFHNFGEHDDLFRALLNVLNEELENDAHNGDTLIPHLGDTASRQQIVNALRAALHSLEKDGARVVFLLDDFDEALQFIDDDDDRLLRTLSDDAALIIATEDPISELRPDIVESSPLLGILRPEALGLISDSAARQLIIEPAADAGVQFSPDEEDFLLTIAGRLPFMLTAACELYYDMRYEYPGIAVMLRNSEEQEQIRAQFTTRLSGLPHVNNIMQLTWSRLSDDERRILYSMAQRHTGDEQDNTTIRHVSARLANKALVYWDIKSGDYCIFSLLFADFVRRRFRAQEGTRRQTSSQPAVHVTEHLSPIDHALLQYFLDHPGRVCTFEELLDAIWEDSDKSKRALEAAVHRLRRSLKSGETIKNIRGKGYKFVTELQPT